MVIDGKQYSGKGQSVAIEDGILDTRGCERVQSVQAELDQYGFRSIEPVIGWAPYTHLIRLEHVVWGILVAEQ